jgi:glutamate decarboxylase
MRVVVREDFTKNRCDVLINDIKLALQTLAQMDQVMMKRYEA